MHIPEWFTKLLDYVSASLTVATVLSWLPHIAASLAIVWWILRIRGQLLNNKKLEKELHDGNE